MANAGAGNSTGKVNSSVQNRPAGKAKSINSDKSVASANDEQHQNSLIEASLQKAKEITRNYRKHHPLDTALLDELQGVKYTLEDIVWMTKVQTEEGQRIVWLEIGMQKNSKDGAGLTHIIHRHEKEFIDNGIDLDEIPDYVLKAINDYHIVGIQRTSHHDPRKIFKFLYNGQWHELAITIGSNGFIVGVNPS